VPFEYLFYERSDPAALFAAAGLIGNGHLSPVHIPPDIGIPDFGYLPGEVHHGDQKNEKGKGDQKGDR